MHYVAIELLATAKALAEGIEPPQAQHPEGYRFRRARVVLEDVTETEAVERAKEQAKRAGHLGLVRR